MGCAVIRGVYQRPAPAPASLSRSRRDTTTGDDPGSRQSGRWLIRHQDDPSSHADPGVAVRRLVHKLPSANLATCNEFTVIVDAHASVATRGLGATRHVALDALFVYQLTLVARIEAGRDLGVGLEAFVKDRTRP